MSTRLKIIFTLFTLALLTLVTVTSFAARGRGMNFNTGVRNGSMMLQMPLEELSVEETQAILKMREEEKLARDVYNYLYELYKAPIFKNIASSEQRHMDAVARLIEKYGLNDPVANMGYGQFVTPEMQELYTILTTKGAADLTSAYNVGATIEDLDIKDLKDLLEKIDNKDIKFVFQNLMKGSRNHLRAFAASLKNLGASYEAQYLSQDEVEDIINSPWERGPVDENGNAITRGKGFRGGGRNFVDQNADGICDNLQ